MLTVRNNAISKSSFYVFNEDNYVGNIKKRPDYVTPGKWLWYWSDLVHPEVNNGPFKSKQAALKAISSTIKV